jgi:hypothetical protein
LPAKRKRKVGKQPKASIAVAPPRIRQEARIREVTPPTDQAQGISPPPPPQWVWPHHPQTLLADFFLPAEEEKSSAPFPTGPVRGRRGKGKTGAKKEAGGKFLPSATQDIAFPSRNIRTPAAEALAASAAPSQTSAAAESEVSAESWGKVVIPPLEFPRFRFPLPRLPRWSPAALPWRQWQRQAERVWTAAGRKTRAWAKITAATAVKACRHALRIWFTLLLAGGGVALVAVMAAWTQLQWRQQDIMALASSGLAELESGAQAMAAARLGEGRKHFARAFEFFQQAEEELEAATNTVANLAAHLDPRARLRRGQQLLAAGQRLARLGALVSRSMESFLGGEDKVPLTVLLEQNRGKLQEISREAKEIALQLKTAAPALPATQRLQVKRAAGILERIGVAFDDWREAWNVVLRLLGHEQDKRYLVLFQNNRELRPTGGFIGSYAVLRIDRGKLEKITVDTIYNPDGQLKNFIVPPAPLERVTDSWGARDANWFVDFPLSARKVTEFIERGGGPTVDGVIAITPRVLEELLQQLGPVKVKVEGEEITLTAEKIVDLIQEKVTYQVQDSPTPKKFLAQLVPALWHEIENLPRERWLAVASSLLESFSRKDVLIYLRDEEAQQQVERMGWGGRVLPSEGDGLMLVAANLGGNKVDHRIEQAVSYDVSINAKGEVFGTVVIRRTHLGSRKGKGISAEQRRQESLPNIAYLRLLVPRGSELIAARGFSRVEEIPNPPWQEQRKREDKGNLEIDALVQAWEEKRKKHPSGTIIGEEAGYTTFENWLVTPPERTVVATYHYRLPFRYPLLQPLFRYGRYNFLWQQQPGAPYTEFSMTVRLPDGYEPIYRLPARNVSVAPGRVSFSGKLGTNTAWGFVFGRDGGK